MYLSYDGRNRPLLNSVRSRHGWSLRFMEELKVFLEGSDVLYGTFFPTFVLYRHSEIFHDSFFLFFLKSIKTGLI